MLAILNSNPILSKEGKPVYGRFFVYQKDTNQPATIYTYDTNKSLVEAQNPVYTNNYGFPEMEIVLDDQIYSIVVEEYLGKYDDPKADDRETMWNTCNSYYEGVVDTRETDSGTAYTVSDLANADISQGTVEVFGYWNSYDCGRRNYVWDDSSSDPPDGGCVIRSNHSTTGRWLLVNSLPYIPSEYYGVYEGHLENLAALFNAPKNYGSTQEITSPDVIKMKAGYYGIATSYATSRTLLLENEVEFNPSYTITCKAINTAAEGVSTTGTGKYVFTDSQAVADTNWFVKFEDMMNSGAKTFIIHPTNKTSFYRLSGNLTLSGKIIVGEGGQIDPPSGGYRLCLDNCVIKGEKFISARCYFKNMEYTDKYMVNYQNPELWYAREGMFFNVANFASVQNYVSVCQDFEIYTIDLNGRTVDTVTVKGCTYQPTKTFGDETFVLRNGAASRILVNSQPNTLVLENIDCPSVSTNINNMNVYNSIITMNGGLYGNLHVVNSILALNGNVGGFFQAIGSVVNLLCGVNVAGNISVDRSHIGVVKEEEIFSVGLIATTESSICWCSNSQIDASVYCFTCGFYDCLLNDQIHTYAIENESEGFYYFSANFQDCIFTARANHILSKNPDKASYDCRVICSWLNNTFNTQILQPIDIQGMNVANKKALIDDTAANHTYVYQGNRGPKVIPESIERWGEYVTGGGNLVCAIGDVFFFGENGDDQDFLFHFNDGHLNVMKVDGGTIHLGRYAPTLGARKTYFSSLLYTHSMIMGEDTETTECAVRLFKGN